MEITSLKKSRSSYKAKLTLFKSYLDTVLPSKDLNHVQVHELNLRLSKIQDMYNDFDSVQTDIENLTDISEQEVSEREKFETQYFGAVAAAQERLGRRAALAADDGSVTGSSAANTAIPGGPNIKLPTIHLPTFSGRYQDWLEYHDTYKSLIHTNTSIPKIHKFHYLRNSLKDSASLIIKSLEFSEENYDVAWELLCDRYHNNRILVNNHIQALFNIQPVAQESSRALRNTIDSVNKNLRALKTLQLPVDSWDILIVHMVTSKLDPATMRDWESERNHIKNIPTLDEFNKFLKNRADLLETMEEAQTQLKLPRRHSDISHNRPKTFIVNHMHKQSQYKCPVCKNTHSIYQCPKFKSMPIESRIEKVKQLNLCTNCLRSGHDEQHCRLSSCRMCSQRHNSMLHSNTITNPQASTSTAKGDCVVLPVQGHTQTQQSSVTLSSTHHSQVLLSTAIINVNDHNGHTHKVRALLDNGSTSSFITESLQTQLRIPAYSTSLSVQGLNKQSSKITKRCDVTISSLTNSGYTADVNCFVVPQITQLIPTNKINCDTFTIPPHIHLADPTFAMPSEVQMLLGADLFWEVLSNNHITLGKNKPTLVETTLGWLVSGSVQVSKSNNAYTKQSYHTVHCHFINDIELEENLNKFFELESVPNTQQIHTKGESECEQLFRQSTTRHPDGKFVVTIPLKDSPDCLGDSKEQALTRFQSLERKFKRQPNFKQRYIEFLDEYSALGHMSENINTHNDKISYFLPHHSVLRETSLTTKLRTVFDGSAITTSGKSFNDIQHVGPIVQDDLLSILIRFRQYKFVVTSDIEKMYRQIYVKEEQRSLQQIFWRSDPTQPIKQYKLNTITYGTASAPYLATRCLAQLGLDCTDKNVSETILHDFYVDDYISGNDDEQTLIQTCKGVIQTLQSANFHLRKWRSNDSSILSQIVNENNNDELLNLSKDDYAKTLGLLWACKKDTLLFSLANKTQVHNINKRTILSTIAQVFDPLGLINPCMLQAKLILQTLWAKNITWDNQLPPEVESHWVKLMKYLPDITEIQIPRRVICDSHVKIELHAFSDASIKAYSACVYIRSVSASGKAHVHLLLAKSRVAPLKQKLTMPRLELCGALLATQLATKAANSLRLKFDSIFFWSDSTIVLGWIKTCKQQLKQFVYNRVSEIINHSDPGSWHYVPTNLNPADIGSRGLNAAQLKSSLLWWEGPVYLHRADIKWPTQPHSLDINSLPEIKIQCNFSVGEPHENNYIYKYSNFGKLQRITAYIKRFLHNCQNSRNKITGPLRTSELNSALQVLCKQVQSDAFYKQYSILIQKRSLPPKDKLLKLNCFIDEANLIRAGGRLSNSNYDYNTKHPILLHSSHHITQILVAHYHKILLHAGPQLLLSTLRHKFWIVNGRNLCRKTTQACLTCLRFSGKTFQPIMGNLPKQRLHADFPFSNTAVDYAGPVLIANRKGRGCQLKKAYIAVFVCLAVRAVHIELVTDLTSQGFIAALNRFIARRGRPTTIFSDNGTNFVGACNELASFLKTKCNDIISYSTENGIDFKFSPAYSPNFNGLAEGSVKSIKHHLKRVLSLANLDYEEMNTVLVQIEAILNSRPLTPLSSDPSDLVPLTPAHFLIGRTLTMLPAPRVDENDAPLSTLSRYRRVQLLKAHFWNRYYNEYVSELQTRSKWRTNRGHPRMGEMVLIKDDRLPPNRWLLGRVSAVYPGNDGVNRVADVTTTSGTLRRAYNRLCPLPTTLDQDPAAAAAAPAPRGPAC